MAKIPDRKNMTTADILAYCRSADSAGGGDETPPPAAAETAAEVETKPAPAEKPTSTKDILAAARAATGGAKPAAKESPAKPAAAKTGAPKAKPTSTKDILAAARAAAAGGGDAAAKTDSAKPTAAKAKQAAPAASASGEKPSVQEMLAAFRSDKGRSDKGAAGQATAKPTAAKTGPPKLPVPPRKPRTKPVPAAVHEDRRGFLVAMLVIPSALTAAWIMLAASTVAWTLAMVRFALPNVLVEPPSRFKVGSPSDYDFGTVSTKWKALRGIWIVHTDRYQGKNVIVALSTVCTHLGCTPNWLESEQKFKCPCHGSGFYVDGINFEGPAPRPLERHGISIAADGMLEVDKSLKFQEEMGQWEDSKSFVSV